MINKNEKIAKLLLHEEKNAFYGNYISEYLKLLKKYDLNETKILDNVHPFFRASLLAKNTKILEYILSLGFDINTKESITKENALFGAIRMNNFVTSSFLLKKGIEVDITNGHGFSPLMQTLITDNLNIEIVKELIFYSKDSIFKNKFNELSYNSLLKSSKNKKIKQLINREINKDIFIEHLREDLF